MAAARSNFPDALVGLAPDAFEILKHRVPVFLMTVDWRKASFDRLKNCVSDLAIDIKLELVCGRVSDSHGTRSSMAR
jgi:hypothetical protein